MPKLDERMVEDNAIELFAIRGYSTAEGPSLSPDSPAAPRKTWETAILSLRLRERLAALNPSVLAGEIDGVARMLARPPSGSRTRPTTSAWRSSLTCG